MAAILLDIDGVLHVSGEPIRGATAAVRQLRENGHRLRFVTNNTTHSRRSLAGELRDLGFDLDDDELQTTALAAALELAGKRVLALTMAAVLEDLDSVQLVGEDAEAVLLGGADETEETNRVFSYMNLARAFAELEAGAELYCLHRNRWWQTSRGPLLDSGCFVAGLEYASDLEATVLGKPSTEYFGAAVEALDAEPELTWMVGDDIDASVAGAQRFGLRTALVRTGKFRPDELERSTATPASRSAVSRPPSRPTVTAARIPLSTTPRGSPARRRSAKRSASASRGSSPGVRSRSPAGRSPPSGSPAGSRRGRSASRPGRSISRCRTRESWRARSAWSPTRMCKEAPTT